MGVNDDILERAISHQIGLMRYAAGTVREIIALLNSVDADLVRKIRSGLGTDATQKRLDSLLKDIRAINAEAYGLVGDGLRGTLLDLATYESNFQQKMITEQLPIQWDVTKPTRQMLKSAVETKPMQGALLKEWVSGMETGRYNRLRDGIRIGFVEGETTDEIVRRVAGTRALQYKDGILDISRRSATALVRTAVNHTATQARELLYQENDDLIKGVRWVSTLDNRTSPICRARDGEVFPPDEGPRPPAHINCRSTTTPVTKSWEELGIDLEELPKGTRASMDGQVPSDVTYADWLKKRSAAEQDDVLGPARGKLFRSGEVTLDRFVDDTGRQYTLDELAKREGL